MTVLHDVTWLPPDTEASLDLTPIQPFPSGEVSAYFTAQFRMSAFMRRWLKPWHGFTGHRHRGTPKWKRRYAHRPA